MITNGTVRRYGEIFFRRTQLPKLLMGQLPKVPAAAKCLPKVPAPKHSARGSRRGEQYSRVARSSRVGNDKQASPPLLSRLCPVSNTRCATHSTNAFILPRSFDT